ncbi:hypothetical protein EVAR_102075_1 [Eumeta japonica]|uniref:Uncharacterized protein n=1 Tax=Eumeta variegata TaxID=151549 RepID=A0A4C1TZV4_EUMVA|nr:hypothetical protein EVAR_102075_1 [Eumeta japonica]
MNYTNSQKRTPKALHRVKKIKNRRLTGKTNLLQISYTYKRYYNGNQEEQSKLKIKKIVDELYQLSLAPKVYLSKENEILPDNLNGENYLDFLQNHLPDLLYEAKEPILNTNRSIIFQKDGCPAHWTLMVREHFNNCFPDSWISRDAPILWPARSSDLTPKKLLRPLALTDTVPASSASTDVASESFTSNPELTVNQILKTPKALKRPESQMDSVLILFDAIPQDLRIYEDTDPEEQQHYTCDRGME